MSALPAPARPLPAPACPLPAPTGPGAGWRPWHGDGLAEGLLAGHHDAPRARRLGLFAADPAAAVTGWRIATLVRALGCDLSLLPDGRVQPSGFGRLPAFLAAEARRQRDALAAWLRIERDVPPALRPHARPPHGAPEALREGADYCIACGPPPAGAVSLWWAGPGSRDWRCATCCPPPDDARTAFAHGRDGDAACAG
jgi:hypothetical protein